MVAFRIRYYQWDGNLNLDGARGEGPIFHIYTGATDLAFAVAVFVAAADVSMLRQEIAVQEETRFPQRLLPTAVRRFAVQRIAQGLKDGRFLPQPPGADLWMRVEEDALPAIRQLLQEKTCTYQIRQGRDLLCSAASADDPTRRGQIGLQTFAPTSRVACRACALPDTDYVCSHLMNPEVRGVPRSPARGLDIRRYGVASRGCGAAMGVPCHRVWAICGGLHVYLCIAQHGLTPLCS